MHIDWAATGSWASFCASIIVGAFIYGRLTQQVKTNSEDKSSRITRDRRPP